MTISSPQPRRITLNQSRKSTIALSCLRLIACDSRVGAEAALTPPLGWSNWNGFEMRFNASLLLWTAKALRKNGLAAKGYTLIQYGGASYPASLVPTPGSLYRSIPISHVITALNYACCPE